MENTAIGLHGQIVQLHVTAEQEQEPEHAITPHHNLMDKIVPVIPLKPRIATYNFVQVNF